MSTNPHCVLIISRDSSSTVAIGRGYEYLNVTIVEKNIIMIEDVRNSKHYFLFSGSGLMTY